MTFSSFVTLIFSGFVKPFLALLLSLCMSVAAIFTGPMGEYQKLQIKTLGLDPMHLGVDYEVSVNANIIALLSGVDLSQEGVAESLGADSEGFVKYADRFDLYTDIGNAKLALTLGDKERNHGVYIDASAFAATPEFTSAALNSISILNSEYADAYEKHTSDYGFYLDFNEMFSKRLAGVSDVEFLSLEKLLPLLVEVYGETFSSVVERENLKLLADIAKKSYEISSKYYTQTKLDGQKAYNFKMTGKEYIQLQSENAALLSDGEFLTSYFAFLESVMNSIDYVKLAELSADLSGLADDKARILSDAETAKQKAKASLEEIKPKLITLFAENGALIEKYADALLTGEGLNELFGEEHAPDVAMFLPVINNSYVSSTLSEKNGAVVENYELCITSGTATIMSIKYNAVTEKYDGAISAPAAVVPFGKRLTPEVLQNKIGYEKAITKGVNTIEITWNSAMTPNSALEITYPEFYLMYNSNNADYQQYLDYVNNPDLTEEEKNNLPKWPDGMEKRESSPYLDTSAQLIENSVYLPLRQLMENAGYEVSWDDAARKAYVTVNDVKIEMTGVIVDNKTYVKVRDFEKLGATVTYQEEFHVRNAWNNFKKSCYATITFGTAE